MDGNISIRKYRVKVFRTLKSMLIKNSPFNPKEYDLLKYLIDNKGKVCTRSKKLLKTFGTLDLIMIKALLMFI